MEALDKDLAWAFYQLEDYGLSEEQLTGCHSFRSTGATCEELALLTFSDEAAAQAALPALEHYLTAQIAANRDYRPKEIPKLEQAFLKCRSTTVLLIVANDYQAASDLIVS